MMARTVTDQEIAAFQRDIQCRAAHLSRRLFAVIIVDVIGFLAAAAWGLGSAPLLGTLTQPTLMAVAGAVLVTLVYLSAGPSLCRRGLRRTLSQLSRVEQARVLLPLREKIEADTLDIVEPLIHGLKVTELLPSAAPTGRGDEAMPTGAGQGAIVGPRCPATEQRRG